MASVSYSSIAKFKKAKCYLILHLFGHAMAEGIKANGVFINNIRYADDIVLFAKGEANLQDIIYRIVFHR